MEIAPRPPSRLPEPEPEREPVWREGDVPIRHGILIGAGAGVSACSTKWCRAYHFKAGGHGRVEIGYRHGRVAPLVSVSGGGGPNDTLDDLEADFTTDLESRGSLTILDVGAGVLVFPVLHSRVDPFFGVRIGWSRVQSKLRFAGFDGYTSDKISRGGFRFAAGVSYYLRPRVALGGRFDFTVPFAGERCWRIGGSYLVPRGACTKIKDLEEEALVDASGSSMPIPFAVTFDVRVILGKN